MKKIIALFLIAQNAWAGLPPTTVKDSGDSVPKTTFNFQFPGMAGTHTGTTYSLGVTTTPTASFFAGWDSNSNLSANNFIAGYATTATAGGTTTLTATSARKQVFTGTSNQTVQLPAVSTLAQGTDFIIQNNSTGIVTVTSSGGNVITTLANRQLLPFTSNTTSGTGASVWDYPSLTGNATPITAWQSYTPTFVGVGTVTSISAYYRQVGDTLEVEGSAIAGTTSASTFKMSLPNSYTIDSAKMAANANGGPIQIIGQFSTTFSASTAIYSNNAAFPALYDSTDASNVYASTITISNRFSESTGSAVFTSTSPFTFSFKAPITQFANSVPIASLANIAAQYNGSLAGSGGGWGGITGTGPGWNDFSVATTSTTLTDSTTAPPINITCSAEATKLPAITCTLPYSGTWTVCATLPLENATSGAGTFVAMTDGSNNLMNAGTGGSMSGANGYSSVQTCGDITTSTLTQTFKLRGQVSAGTESILQYAAAPINWSIYPKTQQRPQPLATGNVSSKGPGQYYHEFAQINCSSSSSIVSAGSGFVSSVGNISAGVCGVTLNSGFSSAPMCWGAYSGSGTNGINVTVNSLSSTSLNVACYNNVGAVNCSNANINLFCDGAH